MSARRTDTNNGELATAFHRRLVELRKQQGSKQDIAKLWGIIPPGIVSIEKNLLRVLHTVARHADRLGIIVEYRVSLPKAGRAGVDRDTPSIN